MPLFYTEALLSGLTAWLPREPSSRDRQAGETKRFQVSSNMERGTERQRGGDIEVVVDEKTSVERQWGEAEVLALMSVWDEVGAQHVADTRATFELISERLRRLSVMRSWWECQTKCRSLGLQGRRPDAAAPGTSTKYSTRVDARPEEGWEQELEDLGNQRRLYPSSGTNLSQEGMKKHIQRALPYTLSPAEGGGRHWTDDEVRALLCVWADQRVRQRLKCTLRNKSIFQEMAYQMQRKFGVVRNWKQCRTKYKNLKYDYKTAKNAHTAGGGASGGPGKYMKFFEEVEAIILDRGLENGTSEMQKRLYEGEVPAENLQTPAGHAPSSESEVVIEIDDDDNSDDYDMDLEAKWRGPASPIPGQIQVVTVSDTGRNWSDQEVRALIQVWSDERVCRQLENSTRKRDIFVQISNRLLQQGIERDWKQCHTKYKNLKYLYRSLQRGKTDEARRLMKFYDEVDEIMNQTNNSSPSVTRTADQQEASGERMEKDCERHRKDLI
ncbi:zinc finger and SCAN domain-containing protein 20 [Cynoglossus semilaevis]|uniref:zinc finger and SCAN domain-containing protein 20 n=1 Tax=Cynoglossus semilaevis TaxID=244447 RepID=UPI000497313A|nr:zinc finger and SCAN domain-containing protein 20 [Cynoglossus semilaevis]